MAHPLRASYLESKCHYIPLTKSMYFRLIWLYKMYTFILINWDLSPSIRFNYVAQLNNVSKNTASNMVNVSNQNRLLYNEIYFHILKQPVFSVLVIRGYKLILEYPPAINIYKRWTKYTKQTKNPYQHQQKIPDYWPAVDNNWLWVIILERREANESNPHSHRLSSTGHFPNNGIYRIRAQAKNSSLARLRKLKLMFGAKRWLDFRGRLLERKESKRKSYKKST